MNDRKSSTAPRTAPETSDADARVSLVQLRAPSPNELLDAVLELSRAVTVDMHTDEVVHAYIERFKKLFPKRLFCVRLLNAQGGDLSMVYATGRLRPERRDRIELSQEALDRHGVQLSLEMAGRIAATDGYQPLFVIGADGFDVPMIDGEQISGVLSVEYPEASPPPTDDRPLIVQLALQLGSALRNSRLHRESVYLRDYLSKLLDHANAPIMVMGRDGEITFVNRAFLTITGFRRDDILGKDWLSLLPEAERRRMLPVYISALHGEPSTNVEVRLLRRDGSFAQVAVNTASILSPDGDVEGVIYIYRDVTELRELEEQVIHAEKLAASSRTRSSTPRSSPRSASSPPASCTS
jgi:PAS domain S-box-containing protein